MKQPLVACSASSIHEDAMVVRPIKPAEPVMMVFTERHDNSNIFTDRTQPLYEIFYLSQE